MVSGFHSPKKTLQKGKDCFPYYKGVSKNRGIPKWMVYNGTPHPFKMDDLGVPLFLETPINQALLLLVISVEHL